MHLVPRPARPNSSPQDSEEPPRPSRFHSPKKQTPSATAKLSHHQQFDPIPLPNSQPERLVIFIDGSSLFYAAMQLEVEIDYTKLLRCLTQDRSLIRAYFYTGVDPARNSKATRDKQQGFLLWMRHNGYRVITKDLIQYPDGTRKANLDVEIAVDMLALSQYCDTLVLLSGTGDLTYVVNAVAYQGKRVEVVSLYSMTSDSLINVADRFIDLATLKESIQKTPKAIVSDHA